MACLHSNRHLVDRRSHGDLNEQVQQVIRHVTTADIFKTEFNELRSCDS